MNPSFFENKRGGPQVWLVLGTIAFLVLVVAAIATWLSLVWPHVWGLFVVLQAVFLAPLLYALVGRPLAKNQAPSQAPPQAPSLVDDLTRTLSRRGITSSLIEAMAQSQRYNTPLSLASLSIDGIDDVTERLGDEAEGAILEAVAATLGEVLRLPDRLGRYQDREFLVVLPQTHAPQAAMVAERLRAAVAGTTVAVQGEAANVTLSAGVAEFGRGQDLEHFLANAHEALGEAHKEGGNRVCTFRPPRTK